MSKLLFFLLSLTPRRRILFQSPLFDKSADFVKATVQNSFICKSKSKEGRPGFFVIILDLNKTGEQVSFFSF